MTAGAEAAGKIGPEGSPRRGVARGGRADLDLYLLLALPLAFLLVFRYVPLYGISIAFKDFNLFTGRDAFDSIVKSPWVGLANFRRVFGTPDFLQVLLNTVIISFYKIAFLFPIPILVAVLLNEVRIVPFKKAVQTVIYLPHFLSWVIVGGMFLGILGIDGVVNRAVTALGGRPVRFFMDASVFRGLLVFTSGWKETGWSTILYLAAITSIDTQLYEAAEMDGAGRFRQALHVTVPGILNIVVFLLILRIGNLLSADFDQILVLYNPLVYKVADVIPTYVYRIGLGQMDFVTGTAVGLFNSVVSFTFILSANFLSKRLVGRSIW